MEAFAVALVFVTLFASTAAVFIFRPLTKRLGEYLRHAERERRDDRVGPHEIERLRAVVERLNGRMELLEDRLDFTERLLTSGSRTGASIGGELPGSRRSTGIPTPPPSTLSADV